jgi:hypothetical protein
MVWIGPYRTMDSRIRRMCKNKKQMSSLVSLPPPPHWFNLDNGRKSAVLCVNVPPPLTPLTCFSIGDKHLQAHPIKLAWPSYTDTYFSAQNFPCSKLFKWVKNNKMAAIDDSYSKDLLQHMVFQKGKRKVFFIEWHVKNQLMGESD